MANLSHYGSDDLAKINLDNKSVNDTLTAELERYKEQVIIFKEGQIIDLKNKDNVSDSCAQSVEIDHLKQTLSEHLKEKEYLMQTVTLLKNDFKKEESRNIDREIALEERIKHLDNIVVKIALSFQNPFYLKKAQQLEPKLYDGNVIEKTNSIVIYDTEETLMLAEESRLKMILKQKDLMMLEKKVNTTPVDYNSVNSPKRTPSSRPTKVEVPKVSMVNTSLKKCKQHLASFDVVVKERTTATDITKENSFSQESAPNFDQLFAINELNAQFQEKDMVIKKLKERIKSLSGNMKEDKIKKELEEIETINIELDYRVTKLIAKNGHLKQTYTQLYDLIKSSRKVFTNIGYIWRPTGRTFTIVGNVCPLIRITTTAKVPLRKPIPLESNTSKPVVVQIVLGYLDSGCSKHMTRDHSQLTNFVDKFLGMVKFGNDHVAKIMGYGDYQIGNVTISRVYFVDGLGHNLFSVGQFCDSDLEAAFRQHTCFICNLEGVDLLIGSRGNNLYTLSLGDMMASSPICLL
nr:integrase, catalytic region, zinc finger, CCHC-type, peptidase aspartic, catalytic [Tanacetum cinerariifolium]